MEIAAYLTLALVALLYLAVDGKARRLERRVARVERKLDLVMEQMGITMTVPGIEEVEQLAREGKTIEAIKTYRKITDADLLEAKQAVDRMTGPVSPGA
ncbi:hypothetical protein ABVG11_08525 [Streptomyces sp. HD1123-B1]|uniref:hypothetical protein n=1 Tax=Streptomyces huangiella TaxID=3228804 RepID=UPI003D7CE2C1